MFGYDSNFWLSFATGGIIIALLQSERFSQPSYVFNPKEPLTRFPPNQLTTVDRYWRSQISYMVAVLALYALFSFLGPAPLKQFNIKVVEATSLPLYICAAFIGLAQISVIGKLEYNLRSRFHRRAGILVAFNQISNHAVAGIMNKFGDSPKQTLSGILDLCDRAKELANKRNAPSKFDFDIFDNFQEDIEKIRKRAALLRSLPADQVEQTADEINFVPSVELRRVVAVLLIPFCKTVGFRRGYNDFRGWAELPLGPPVPIIDKMWDRALISVPVTVFVLLIFALAATQGLDFVGVVPPPDWPAKLIDGLMIVIFASVTTLATMFFGLLLAALKLGGDNFEDLDESPANTLTPWNYAAIFWWTYIFSLIVLSLLNWFDINKPWISRVDAPELLSSFIAVPKRVLISAIVPAVFATACVHLYFRTTLGESRKWNSWLGILAAASALGLLYSIETNITGQLWPREPAPTWSLLYVFIVGFILGASITYVLTSEGRLRRLPADRQTGAPVTT